MLNLCEDRPFLVLSTSNDPRWEFVLGIGGHSTWDVSHRAWLGSLRKCLLHCTVVRTGCQNSSTPSSTHHFTLSTGKGPAVQPSVLPKPRALLAAVVVSWCVPVTTQVTLLPTCNKRCTRLKEKVMSPQKTSHSPVTAL